MQQIDSVIKPIAKFITLQPTNFPISVIACINNVVEIPGEANREDDSDSYDLSGGIIGVILYNPTDRDGAELEADHLESGLRPHASHVIKNAWSTERELFQHMDIDIVGFSALVICISSHGMAGTLRCEDGDGAVAINDILFKLSRHLPCWMPLVG